MAQKILIIEDEPGIAENITYALSTDGFSSIWCRTGADGLSALRDDAAIGLIILDVGLPDKSGFEIAREIRTTRKTPIIFVTARADEVDRIVGLELGADDYVIKPFSPRELVARVRAVLRRVHESGASGGTAGAPSKLFSVDDQRFLISYRGEALDLSRYEFRLLRILIKSPGRVFEREHLMQLAWESPEMSLERTVDTHIKTIRQKLKRVYADADPIVTHRGIGYSLSEDE